MKEFLVVLFMINGQPTLVEGWFPLQLISRPCDEVIDHTRNYMLETLGVPEDTIIACVSADTPQEAVERVLKEKTI